ncbi:hypothetical protein CW304_22960 [Bacillus sp. UFRGS-B20]|nr:hypothetical protein CW304_22960 [Bacillus sp. UFRGS-B20]
MRSPRIPTPLPSATDPALCLIYCIEKAFTNPFKSRPARQVLLVPQVKLIFEYFYSHTTHLLGIKVHQYIFSIVQTYHRCTCLNYFTIISKRNQSKKWDELYHLFVARSKAHYKIAFLQSLIDSRPTGV